MKRLMIIFAACAVILAGCGETNPLSSLSAEQLQEEFQTAVQAQDYAKALTFVDEMLRRTPNDFDALAARGFVLVFAGRFADAEKEFLLCIRIDKKKGEQARFFAAERAMWRSRELSAKGDDKAAIAVLDGILAMYPKAGLAYHERGAAKIGTGDYKGAIADLTKAIEHDSGNNRFGDSFELRARAKEALGDTDGAQTDRDLAKSKTNESEQDMD